MTLFEGPIWLIGCGNMAGAMLQGWLRAGADPRSFTVIRPSGTPVAEGVRVLTALPEDEVPALVLLGVKPQKLDEVAPSLAPALAAETILLSILAGVELGALRARFAAPATIVKAMPNLPVALGKGVTELISDSEDADARARVDRLIGALGHVEWFEDEAGFNIASGLTGAAPAFLFRFLDALAGAATELGLAPDQAARLAARMAEGAAALAAGSDATPTELARRVASPGGTTEAGLKVLDSEEGLKPLMLRTLDASRRREAELAAAARRG
ncbi:pyrroline-5-carboxylate reductase [Sphingosinicella sp. BN140058]|uniref:pyrroline-5-carboxylate reductase family protein n=1 Tax=Sphingosinicella sp. BN140058 TaxID=1892855 RepID=UPI0010122210|nr:pyrroline-5-carboxylate reductase dimerization domain-containing protein [Sphingosinicella sp. BN140058]QAY76358.1 pyrroline-5-carboxylate reductase [Sphingosinicella sp. BN140058]